MGIDTVEAQSSFLAHAAESGSFAQMTEQGAEKRPYAPFIGRGPIQVTWEAGYIQALAYVELRGEQLEAEAADLETKTPGSPEATRKRELAALAKEATTAIKGDIKEAANPKYAFLFSLGAMELTRGVKRSANLKGISSPAFAGNRDEDQWVTNFTESFQDTLDKAPARKAEAEARAQGRGGRAGRRAGRGRRRPQGDREEDEGGAAASRCRWARCATCPPPSAARRSRRGSTSARTRR